ncbi:MAG TPA: 4Fe-4S dicluster domain-containing protein [Bryobacteraceae bacterium]|nr:4Fe-4S dicluster domain-containing protein [Bryobacteraceae bacterium]
MSESARPDKGSVVINGEECKGCGLCVVSCALGVLRQSDSLNRYGYHPAEYAGHGCNGCGLCFYACPEPGAIAVYKRTAVPRASERELVAA